MEVRAKKALGQHFLTDQKVARAIVDALQCPGPVLEIGPGMGVLTQYLLQREDVDLKLVEIDGESVEYLLAHFPGMQGRLLQADFLTLRLEKLFPERFAVIGNFPYNISSQIFFKILDRRGAGVEDLRHPLGAAPGLVRHRIPLLGRKRLLCAPAEGGIGRHPPQAQWPILARL